MQGGPAGGALDWQPDSPAGHLPGPPGPMQGLPGHAGAPGFRPQGAPAPGLGNPGGPWQGAPGFLGRPGPPDAGAMGGPNGLRPPVGPGMGQGVRPGMEAVNGRLPGGLPGMGAPGALAGDLDSLLTHKSARDRAKTEKCALLHAPSHALLPLILLNPVLCRNISCMTNRQGAGNDGAFCPTTCS